MRLSFRKPITTRLGNPVRLYHIYDEYIHGAYQEVKEDYWYPCAWTIDGYYNPNTNGKQYTCNLDLINESTPEWDIPNPKEAA
jgi:hypothetical protein